MQCSYRLCCTNITCEFGAITGLAAGVVAAAVAPVVAADVVAAVCAALLAFNLFSFCLCI